MLSLSNSYNAEEVAQWAERVQAGLPDEEVEFVVELKYVAWPSACGTKTKPWSKP